ncbi:MAG: hypothetical protein ACHREM_09795 [Polyangiales bacterium]
MEAHANLIVTSSLEIPDISYEYVVNVQYVSGGTVITDQYHLTCSAGVVHVDRWPDIEHLDDDFDGHNVYWQDADGDMPTSESAAVEYVRRLHASVSREPALIG